MFAFSEAQLMEWLTPVLWPFLRVLAVFTAAPVFSMRSVPVRVRIGLAFFIALCAQPGLEDQARISINSPQAWGAVVQQVGVGLAIGFVVRLVFAAVELAGEVVGFQMGLNFAAFFDPSLNAQSSAVARFYGQMATFMFVVMNGHLLMVLAVIRSFEAFPLDQNFLQAMRSMRLHTLGAEVFSVGLWIALPVVGMLMLVNLVLGIISRVAPQMNVFAIGFPITLSVGLIGLAVTLPMLDQPFFALLDRTMALFAR